MNDRQLRYALAVWRERSFSRAAGHLNVSQSAISAQVKSLEHEVGFPLFRRTGQGVEVTDLGRTFLQQAKGAVAALTGLTLTVRHLRGGPAETLGIGLISGIASRVIPPIVDALRPSLPRTRLEVITAPTRRIHASIAEERIDIGVTIEVDPRGLPTGLSSENIAPIEMALILPPSHPIVARGRKFSVEELADESIIMNELTIGYGEFVLSMFSDRGIRPNIAAVVDNVETIKSMVRSAIGIAVIPYSCVQDELRLGELAALPISFSRCLTINLVRRSQPMSPMAERSFDAIKAALRHALGERGSAETVVDNHSRLPFETLR